MTEAMEEPRGISTIRFTVSQLLQLLVLLIAGLLAWGNLRGEVLALRVETTLRIQGLERRLEKLEDYAAPPPRRTR